MKYVLGFFIFIMLVLGGVYFASPIQPEPWNPQPAPLAEGEYAPNDRLLDAVIINLIDGHGPEDVARDRHGNIYGGLADGRIVRLLPDGSQQTFATIQGGRPLGLHFDGAGNLIVADAWKGLLSFAPDGSVKVLTSEADDGIAFAFTDDLDIASDGRIYFSDASDRWHQPDYMLDLLEGQPRGRLLVYDPATATTTTLLDDLYFANGVALSQDESFLLVNETGRYRVRRYWLSGDKAGTNDIFIDNLPGFPDGISSNRQGLFWLAIPSPRLGSMDAIASNGFLKKLVAAMPKSFQPAPVRMGYILGIDETGSVVHNLQDTNGAKLWMITSVQQEGDMLYLGSLEAPQIGVMKVPVDK